MCSNNFILQNLTYHSYYTFFQIHNESSFPKLSFYTTSFFYLNINYGMVRKMYSCWDCKKFGINCKGKIAKGENRNDMEKQCKDFILNEWRNEMSKRIGDNLI